MVRTAATAIKTTGGKSSKAAAAAGGSGSSTTSGTSKKLTGGGGHHRFVKVAVPNWQKPITIFLKPGCKYNNWRKETIVDTNLAEDEIEVKSPSYESETSFVIEDGAAVTEEAIAGTSSDLYKPAGTDNVEPAGTNNVETTETTNDEAADANEMETEYVDSTDDEARIIAEADTDSDEDSVNITINKIPETTVKEKKTIYESVETKRDDDTSAVDPVKLAKIVKEKFEAGGIGSFNFSELTELEDISFKEQAKERALMEANAKGVTKRAKSKATITKKGKANKENGEADDEEFEKKRSFEDSDEDNAVDAKKVKV